MLYREIEAYIGRYEKCLPSLVQSVVIEGFAKYLK